MYILIEHNGSQDHLEFVKKIQELLEDEYGATVEQVIGHNDKTIILYSEDLEKITELSPMEDLSVLSFYINNYYEDEL